MIRRRVFSWLAAAALAMGVSGLAFSPVRSPLTLARLEMDRSTKYADRFAGSSRTAGIQEAVDACSPGECTVQLSAKVYRVRKTIWLTGGVHLHGAGIGSTVIQRAAGSMSDEDADGTGSVVAVSPRGSAGTFPTLKTSQASVAVSDLTIDGNASSFSALKNINLHADGIRADYVDGLIIRHVAVRNALMNGYYIRNCKNVLMDHFRADLVGQWSQTASKNGVSLTSVSRGGFNFNYTLSHFEMRSVGNEAISTNHNSHVDISSGWVDGCDFALEFGGDGTGGGYAARDIVVTGLAVHNARDYFITFNSTAGDTYEGVSISDSSFSGSPRLHDGGAIFLNPGSSGNSFRDIHFSSLHFRNVNSKDASSRNWIDLQPSSLAAHTNITFDDITLLGKPGSARTGDVGLNLRGSIVNLGVTGLLIQDVPGMGISIDDPPFVCTSRSLEFNRVTVDGANYYCAQIRTDSAAATIEEVTFTNSTMKDCAQQGAGSNAGWHIQSNFPGSRIQNITLKGCRSYRTRGTNHAYGVTLEGTAGMLDSITLSDCDFTGTTVGATKTTGSVTHFEPGTGTTVPKARLPAMN